MALMPILEAALDVYGALHGNVAWLESYTSKKVMDTYGKWRADRSLTTIVGANSFINLLGDAEMFNKFLVRLLAELLISCERELVTANVTIKEWKTTEKNVLRKMIAQQSLPVPRSTPAAANKTTVETLQTHAEESPEYPQECAAPILLKRLSNDGDSTLVVERGGRKAG